MNSQAVKLAPFVPAWKAYFKTKLCCHNFTIFLLVMLLATEPENRHTHKWNVTPFIRSTMERKPGNRETYLPSNYASVTKEARLKPKLYDVQILNYTFSDSKFLRYVLAKSPTILGIMILSV
nr:unnamed protein product [Callosobruchus chinensis]